MSNELFFEGQDIRGACPKGVCTCGYYDIIHDNQKTPIDVLTRMFPGLKLTQTQENNIRMSIKNLTTLDQFINLREFLRIEYGITFLIQKNGHTKIDSNRGLCEKTRKRIQARFWDTFNANNQLVFDILNRGSLLGDASDERE